MVDVVKDRKETRINEKLSPLFLSLVVLITVCLLALSFYLRVSYFYSTDKAFIYEQVTPKVLKQFEGFPDLITVGLNIEQFQVFDVAKDNFEFSGTLWFSMGKGSLSLETLEKFRFDRGTILHRSEPNMSISRNSIIVRYLVRVAFNSGPDFQDFPLDDHLVTLILSNPFLEPEEALFDTSTANLRLIQSFSLFGWELNTKSARTGFASVHLSEQQNSFVFSQPVVQFSLEVERYGIRFLLTILLPIILIFCIMCFSLALEPTQSLSIASGGVTAIIAYRFVIEQLSPKSGDLMLSDNFFFLILAGALMLFVLISLDIFLGGLKCMLKKISLVVINLFILGVSITLLFAVS